LRYGVECLKDDFLFGQIGLHSLLGLLDQNLVNSHGPYRTAGRRVHSAVNRAICGAFQSAER